MFAKTFALASFSLLAACAPTVVVKTECPPLVNYDQAFMSQLSDELATSGPAVQRAIVDYRQLRDVVRACSAVSR